MTVAGAPVVRPLAWDTCGSVVARGELVARLLQVKSGLVVVTSPAGYGKSTVIGQWDDADSRPFAWVCLNDGDNDPTALRRRIRAAVLPAVLVLDDVHRVTSPASLKVLQHVVETLAETSTVVLVGRSRPALDLARRRLQHTVVEFGVAELRFSAAEALAAGGADDAAEGWPAGLALTALARRDRTAAGAVTGRHRLVADYVAEEVLGALPEAVSTFLVESSILDQFCARQLDAVLGRNDSTRLLEALWRDGNSFLISLDAERVWFRHHRLVGEALRARLQVADPRRYHELAGRAAEVLERDGDVDGALRYAVVAGDRRHAAALLGRDAVRLGFDGHAAVLASRVGLVDERTFVEHPDAALARAWLGVARGDAELIQTSVLLAARADRGQPLADGTPSVSVAAALVGSLVGVGGISAVLRHADAVRDAGDHLVNPWWGAATVMKGAALSMAGDVARARLLLESAVPVIDDLPGFHAAALAHLALLDLGEGDDASAVENSVAAHRIAEAHGLGDVVPMVVVYAARAVTAARVGDVPTARAAIGTTERLLDGLGSLAARTALLGHGLLAWTASVLGDRVLLRRHLTAGDRAARREPEALALLRRIERVRMLAAGGDHSTLTAAELRLLPRLATHLSLQAIADELSIGRETAKSQVTSIYRKLGVSTRSGAVDVARGTGLLPD